MAGTPGGSGTDSFPLRVGEQAPSFAAHRVQRFASEPPRRVLTLGRPTGTLVGRSSDMDGATGQETHAVEHREPSVMVILRVRHRREAYDRQ